MLAGRVISTFPNTAAESGKITGRCVNILVYRTYKRLNIRVGGFRARGVNKGGDHGRWDGPSQMTLSLQTARDKGNQRAREDDEGD